jgi:hypothetical protein
MRTPKIMLLILGATIMMSSLPVSAQIGNGRGGGRGQDERPGLQITPPAVQLPEVSAPEVTVPSADSITLPAIDLPSYQSITVPDDLPTLNELEDYLLALESTIGEVAFDLSALDDLALETSPEAYAAIVAFASQHLGTLVSPLYAGVLSSEEVVVPESYNDLVAMVLTQFPEDMQAVIDQAATISGAGYWAIFPEGAATLYTGDCADNPACTVAVDGLEFQLNNSAVGLYGLYGNFGTVLNADDALRAIQAAFPRLTGYPFTPIPVESGYAFAAVIADLERETANITLVYAGAVGYGDTSLAWALVALGDGYVQLALG